MHIRHIMRVCAVVVATLLPATAVTASTRATSIIVNDDESSTAAFGWFEGRQIDLTQEWGTAKACAVTPRGTRCFRDEAQMDRFLGFEQKEAAASASAGGPGFDKAAMTCSSSIRLYDGSWFSGTVLSIAIQW